MSAQLFVSGRGGGSDACSSSFLYSTNRYGFVCLGLLCLTAIGVLPHEAEGPSEQEYAETLSTFFQFLRRAGNEVNFDRELIGLHHVLPIWQWFKVTMGIAIRSTLTGGQRYR